MPLTGTHKTDLQTVQAGLAALRASLSMSDQQQREVANVIDLLLRSLALISDVRNK